MENGSFIQLMTDAFIVPVFYHEDLEKSKQTIKACYDAGLMVFEYTNRGTAALENFPLLLEFVKTNCPDMVLGVGSITDQDQAAKFIDLDAEFIVAPILEESTYKICKENNRPWIPGCGTLSEMMQATKLGASIVKLFPAEIYGPAFIKAVLGPCSDLKIMPTGGVKPTMKNLSTWYNAGAVCVGMGAQLFDKTLIDEDRFDELGARIKSVVNMINEIKN